MTDTTTLDAPPPSPPPILKEISSGDVYDALREGWADFRAAPAFGLFFGGVYVVGGLLIWLQLAALGQGWLTLALAVGFPLLGPFAAIGLYEVSRRIEAGEALDWGEVLGVIFRQKDRQTPSMVVIVILFFLFWIYIAHLVFALFFGISALTNVTSSPEIFLSARGMMMLAVGIAVGAGLSFILFAITVVGLPLLLDREIDVVSAMIASVQSVAKNPTEMLTYGAIVSVLVFAAMIPAFLGLLVALPLLGHATWRLYRKAVTFPDAA